MENDFVKITSALYRILETWPDSDPLKNRMKEKALNILDKAIAMFDNLPSSNIGQGAWTSLKQYLTPGRKEALQQLLKDILLLEKYLVIGKDQGWISTVNFLIINKEYKLMEDWLQKQLSAGLPIAQGIIEQLTVDSSIPVLHENFKNTLRAAPKIRAKSHNDRQKKILAILSKREKTQVADIIKELPQVTKRTIRRDLDDLLKRGEIVRIGQWNQAFYRVK